MFVLDLYHAFLARQKIFKIDLRHVQKLVSNDCSNLNKMEGNDLSELMGTLSGQTGPIAFAQHVIFFSNIPKTAILWMLRRNLILATQ